MRNFWRSLKNFEPHRVKIAKFLGAVPAFLYTDQKMDIFSMEEMEVLESIEDRQKKKKYYVDNNTLTAQKYANFDPKDWRAWHFYKFKPNNPCDLSEN